MRMQSVSPHLRSGRINTLTLSSPFFYLALPFV